LKVKLRSKLIYLCIYIYISYFIGILVALSGFYLGGYEVMNSCMFTCVTCHLIGLQVGCSGTIVETCYHVVHGEFPCCLVGGRLDSVGAVVYLLEFVHRSNLLKTSCFGNLFHYK
jgi:hypothetical protein